MALERAATLYLRNDTTVDTGTGIDIRLLDDVAGATDETQTATATHAQDNVERTFDPATAAAATVADSRTLQKKGWALRLTEDMTPADDTNCDAMLPAGTLTVNMDLRIAHTGGTYAAGTFPFTGRASLWKYNPSTDTGTLIAEGSHSATTWTLAQVNSGGTYKTIPVSIVVAADVTFAAGEILLLQVGLNSGTIPNPTLGTATFTYTLRLAAVSAIVWAAGQGIRAKCALAQDMAGEGLSARAIAGAITRDVVGEGLTSATRVVVAAKSLAVAGEGLASRQFAAALTRDVVGEGLSSSTKVLVAARTVTVVGDGVATRDPLLVALARTVLGEGLSDGAKAVVAFRTATVSGEGVVTDAHPVQAYRTFTIAGEGVTTRQLAITQPRDVIGEAVVNGTKAVVAAKTFTVAGEGVTTRVLVVELSRSVVGEGFVTEAHPVQAFRTFTATGEGQVVMEGANGSRIELPLADLPQPEGGATQTVIRPVIVFDD